MLIIRALFFVIFFICSTICSVLAEDTIRVCTWNLLDYSIENDHGRTPLYKKILDQIKPDILVVQEMKNQEAALKFLSEVLNSEIWAYSEYNSSTGAEDMLYFNPKKLDFYGSTVYPTDENDVTEYTFQVKASRDTLRIFSCNFHEGETQEDYVTRNSQVTVVTERIGQIRKWNLLYMKHLVLGSLNLTSFSEEGASRLYALPLGFLQEPFNKWVSDDTAYAQIYTQSTRTVEDISCGGGSTGGINDRYDMILHANNMKTVNYVAGSYTVYGNDGKDRLNSAIDNPPNTAVSTDIAAALRCASDHLPVFADYRFSLATSVEERGEFGPAGIRIYPMPVTTESVVELGFPADRILIIDILGREIYSIAVEGRDRVSIPPLAPGVYLCRVGQIVQLFSAE